MWLCAAHASPEFQCRRNGRDFVVTLQRLWQAHGCLTAARARALAAHLDALAGPPPARRPGSYAWPDLRRRAEAEFALGGPPLATIARLRRVVRGRPGRAAERPHDAALAPRRPLAAPAPTRR